MKTKDNAVESGWFIIEAIIALVLLLTLSSCGEFTAADKSGDELLRREALPLTYHIAEDVPEHITAEIHAAFNEWETSLNYKLFHYGGKRNREADKFSNGNHATKNVIFVTEESGKFDPPYGDGHDAIARTFVRGLSKIRDTDVILFNFTENYINGRSGHNDVYSVRTVMIHEIGRMLFGNKSGADDGSVLNNPVYPKGHPDEKTTLSQGDIDLFYEFYGDMI